jgi:hypothetical protein
MDQFEKSPNELKLKRDSFDHRICNDLCGVLLSYLTFEEKLYFESVSKLFKISIFDKQNSIKLITGTNDFGRKGNNSLKLIQRCGKNKAKTNLKAFETILKKCKFINKIDFNCCYHIVNNEKTLLLINKYCENLKVIKFDFIGISDETLTQFGLKFGQNLRSLVVLPIIEIKDLKFETEKVLFRFCPNIKSIDETEIDSLIVGNKTLLKSLTKVVGTYDYRSLENLADHYKNTVKILNVVSEEEFDYVKSVQQISRLNNLENLRIELESNPNQDLFIDGIKNIAMNCTKLTSFELSSYVTETEFAFNLFNAFKYFSQLKRLSLYLIEDFDHEEYKEISVETLKNCQNLTYLSLHYPKVSDNTFKKIDLYLPKLKYIQLYTENNIEITNETMKSLSKLKDLKFICFANNYLHSITDKGFGYVLKNCPNLQSIKFAKRPNISEETVNALIQLAIKKPRIHFYHEFGAIDEEISTLYPVLDMKKFQNLPKNLNLKIDRNEVKPKINNYLIFTAIVVLILAFIFCFH